MSGIAPAQDQPVRPPDTLRRAPRLLTVHQVARRLGLSELTVRRRIARGDIPAVQIGGKHAPIRVDEAELERWLYGAPGKIA